MGWIGQALAPFNEAADRLAADLQNKPFTDEERQRYAKEAIAHAARALGPLAYPLAAERLREAFGEDDAAEAPAEQQPAEVYEFPGLDADPEADTVLDDAPLEPPLPAEAATDEPTPE
jgi:hypothetical protein